MKKLILFELRKVFSKRLSLIALVGILLFSVLISFSTYQNKYAFDGVNAEGSGKTAVEIDKGIAAKYEGILTDEKVQQMMSDFAPTSDLHGLSAIYVYQNAMQSAAFSRFSDKEGNWNGLSVSDVFGNEEIKIGYVDGWLSTSRNMVRVFVALALAVIIMLAPIFSGEYEGVDNIILTSKYGKTKCATAKVIAGIITAILTTTLVAAINLLLAFVFYGTEGLDCSILFAPSDYVEAFIPFNITCGTLLKYQILLAFTCTLSVTGITLFLSAISKNQIVALVAAMAIFLFPVLLPITEVNPLFRLVGLLPIYHVLAISLLSVEQMSNGMLYAIWAIPVALLFLGVGAGISRRVFAKHQVS
ncbi:ABC-type transport system involved in multi-copper enzyme maturation%2C permease component [uncultured Clostridium sp.]|nr:ABC-type transport system involved in multi-copper enzyme maturation%2C permease component [uncultured Clostridium sp.]